MKHKPTRRLLSALCALALMLSLAACSGGEKPQGAPEKTPAQSQQEPAQTPSPEPAPQPEPEPAPEPEPEPEPKKELISQTLPIDDLTYDFNNGKLTITGSGQVTNEGYGYVLEQCNAGKEDLTELVFGEGVAFEEKLAFSDCINLIRVTLPENIDTICPEMFARCGNLTTVETSAAFVEIGNDAFYECTSLEKMMDLAPGARIGFDAFNGCSSLTEAVFPEMITICPGAFVSTGLVSVTIPVEYGVNPEYLAIESPKLTDVTILGSRDRYWVGLFCSYPDYILEMHPEYSDYKLTIHAPAGSYAETYFDEWVESRKRMLYQEEECRVTFEALP